MVKYYTSEEILKKKDEITAALARENCIRGKFFEMIQARISELPKTASILELGPGAGYALDALNQAGFSNLHNVDIDDYLQFKEFKKRFKKCDLNTQKLPYKDNTFDCVLALEVFEHLENFPFALRECARVLKKGGLLVFSRPNGWSIYNRIRYLKGANTTVVTPGNNHINDMSRNLLMKLTEKYFKFERIIAEPAVVPLIHIPIKGRVLFSDHLCFVFKKAF
ncbi:MAG: methyltransferase domain-containing protein [Candidatus Woesearchaeota archaeon]|jgi:ubiquinone/menaquinone biosynthesis C-methylase UbiE|nr:methyltransferase domain-containing protein [Candidatus Woesearchaeota archaeon]MDP7198379.1 methyltransferase domain-containing protein [Candidatus Woesearchaeota archaeon]MDP7467481.1 methyltransferase domain-containing protein [Candidatus Woesearchaeota archaeon]MDP7647708.1 methyltransferase domain-containing protein [Candidatus Woesearchaeota archaeon]|tara:strand:+ start:334 stop:1002 length:669 start_codon:yes stop_codon:yes gene_type:complete